MSNELRRVGAAPRPVETPDADELILVDAADREIGHRSKRDCHSGSGLLHRAFSIWIFNARHELLLQQRSETKALWPLYWSNSCCSHPRRGESMAAATHRRLMEELGLRCPLQFLYKFQYQAQYDAVGAERELCSVFVGYSTAPVRARREEIAASRWIGVPALRQEMSAAGAARFTPWFRLEWERVWSDHLNDILTYGAERSWASR